MIRRATSLAVVLLLIQGCTAKTAPASDHFSGSRFHNRGNAAGYSLWDEIRIAWELRTKKRNWPARFETKQYVAPAEPVLKGIRVLWVGHSTTLIQTPHLSVLTDPILFDSIGPGVFGLHTVTNPGLRIDSLPRIDVILISHNHYDHLDVRSLRTLVDRQRTAPPMILAGLGVGPLLKSAGFSSYSELDWGESAKVKDARVHFLEAVHTSRRSIGDTDKTLWGSFLIDTPEGKIYFAGDSAYGTHFRTIYERFGAPRVSLLPIGAYEPRWFMYRMHMNPEEAVRAHLDLHSENSVGIHFGMIDNAGESYDAPVNDLIAARQAHGVEATRFVAPAYGQLFRYVGTVAALSAVIDRQGWTLDAVLVGIAGMGLTFGMWWVYYLVPSGEILQRHRNRASVWGYAQILIVTSIVATGAGLHVAASFIEQKADITPMAAMLAVAVPVVLFLALLHAVHYFLVRHFRSTDAWLLISSIGVAMISVIAALSGISTAACLVLLAFAPALTILTYELRGYQAATLAN